MQKVAATISLPRPQAAPLADPITVMLGEIENGERLSMGAAARVLGGIDPSSVFRHVTVGSR